MLEIRQFKYYRKDFETFEEYCLQRHNIGRAQAYRWIEASEVKESLPDNLSKLITNESQARALAEVPEDKRATVIREVKKSGEPITAAAIREVHLSPIGDKDRILKMGENEKPSIKNSSSEKPIKPVKELDDVGTVIPDDALPFWKRRQEIQDLLSSITKIKSVISKAKEGNDPMFSKVSNAVLSDLSQAYTHLLEGKPYAVCTTCQGSFSLQPKGCSFCGNKGLISKWQWDTQSRREVKDMRTKANALRK